MSRCEIVPQFVHQAEAPASAGDVLVEGRHDIIAVPLDRIAGIGPCIDRGGTDGDPAAVVGTMAAEEFHILLIYAVQPAEPGVNLFLRDGRSVNIGLLDHQANVLAGTDVHPFVVADGDVVKQGRSLGVGGTSAQAGPDHDFRGLRFEFEPHLLPVPAGPVDALGVFGPDGGVDVDGDMGAYALLPAAAGLADTLCLDFGGHHIGGVGDEACDDLCDALVGEIVGRGDAESPRSAHAGAFHDLDFGPGGAALCPAADVGPVPDTGLADLPGREGGFESAVDDPFPVFGGRQPEVGRQQGLLRKGLHAPARDG